MKPKKIQGLPMAFSVISLTFSILTASPLQAASSTWNGTTDANWATLSNWGGGPVTVPGTGETATFNNAANGRTTLDLGAGVTIGSVVFDTASAPAHTIGAGGAGFQTLTLSNAAAALSIANTVTNSQLINANLALATTGTYASSNESATGTLTLAGGINTSTAGAKFLTLGGAGKTTVTGVVANGTGTLGLNKSGTGTLTLSNANTFTDAVAFSASSSGTIVLANPNALANSARVNFAAYTGNTLEIATDTAVTPIPTNSGTNFASTLLINRATAGAAVNHTLGTVSYGGGTLTVQPGANVTSGVPAITFPTVQLNAGSAVTTTFNPTGTTLSLGTVTIGSSNPSKTLGLGGTSTGNEVTGAISNGAGTVSVNKTGTSTWTMSGVSTYTGVTTITTGTLNVTGNSGPGSIAAAGGIFNVSGALGTNAVNGNFRVGTAQNVGAVMNVLPGAVANTRFNLFVGDFGGAATTAGAGGGAIYQSGGSITLTQAANQDNLRIGSNASGYGYYKLSGGSLTTNEAGIGAGLAGTVGVVDVSGGTFTTNGYITLGRGATTSSGLLNVTGGTVAANRIHLDWAATAGATSVLNVGGGGTAAAVNIAPSATLGLDLANSTVAGTVGIANILANGTLTTGAVFSGQANPTAILNINGGTLKAATTNGGVNFLTSANLDNVLIYGGGATIDNNATNITVSRPLEAPTGSGVASIPVTTGGAGYIGAPMVTISGGGGTGATAYATINASGVLTGLVVTSAGIGYTSAPTVTLTGGGPTTLATLGAATLGTNTSGGVAFQGSGITSLGAASTYTGATQVTGGTLKLDLNGNVNASSGITVNGSGAKFVQAHFDTTTAPVTITQGALDGTGTINAVTVANNAANSITTGAGSNFGLTVGALTFQGAASLTATANGLGMERTITAGSLTTNAAGKVTVNITNSAAWVAGDYPVISYGSFSGNINDFQLTPVTGLSPRQSASLILAGGAVNVRITGDSLTWTGTQNSNWTTSAVGGDKNWLLPSSGDGTEFLTNDVVVFDDSPVEPSSYNVNIASNVSPSSVIFDNTRTYTFTSTGGFGISGGKITKNNTGLVILATNNTYTGTTTVNGGVLQIGDGTVNGNINSSSLITSNAVVDLKVTGTQTYSTAFAGTGWIVKSGTGTLNLTGTATFTGNTGGFELAAGTLNVNSASALGTTAGGSLKITGGILNTTIGGGITTAAAQPQTWAGDFTFTGSNNLNFNGGVVTLTGGGSRTVNVAAGTLGTGRLASADTGLNLTGPGTLAITTSVASNILGPLNVAAGSKLRMNTGADGATTQDFVTTGLTGAGTVENGGGIERWMFVDNATDQTFAGTLQNGAAGALGFQKNAGGTLTLTGSNTFTGRLTIAAGTLSVPSISNGGFASALGASALGADRFYIGNNNGTATLLYTGGDVTSDRGMTLAANTGFSSVIDTASHLTFTGVVDAINTGGFIKRGTGVLTFSNVGATQKLGLGGNGGTNVFGANIAQGKLELKNGTFTPGGEIVIGGQLQTAGAYTSGNLEVNTGATLATANWISIGRGNGDSGIISTLTVDSGVINQSGATAGLGLGYNGGVAGFSAAPALDIKGASNVTVAGSLFCGESVGANALITVGGTSTLNLTGVTQANKVIAVGGKGTLTINSGLVNAGITGFMVARDAGSDGTVNLNGGILASGSTLGGAGTSALTINGGTLRADTASTTFLSGFTTASLGASGGIIDTQAFAVTAAQALTGSGGLAKNGAGTLTFTGVSSYTGNTTVNAGTLALADNAGLKFVIGANGVSNKLTGAGAATLDGDFTLDLTGAAIGNGNSWTLVDTTTKTFNAAFSVNGFTEAADVWTLVSGNNTWTFTEATGVLTLSVSGSTGYASWINGFGLGASDKDALDDPDFDGISNLMEYVLGGNPAVSGSAIRPTGAKSGTNLVLTFNRSDISLAAGDAPLKVEYGNNLAGWTTVLVPAASSTVAGVVFTITDGSPGDTIVASIPVGAETKFFGRVKAEK